MLAGKKIVLGITGSIAAYKACQLIRLLVRRGAEVQVVITPAGKEFITPLTLSTLTGKPVVSEFFDRRDGSWHSHVQLGLWADLMVVAPASASTIAKMARGIADNMLITTYLSMKAPVMVAPAMDLDMYAHPATQENLTILAQRGVRIVEAASGELASHLVGKGRMQEPEAIVEAIDDMLTPKDLDGKRVLITCGPTHEMIDPVRFVGNCSSGKMGMALAVECAKRGAEVELVCGPVTATAQHPLIHRTDVVSAAQMADATISRFPHCHAAILCAAVADFTPAHVADQKIKHEAGAMTIELVNTVDIAATLGQMKRADQRLVGFALETTNEATNARGKLDKKNLDMIVLNSLNDSGAGFQHDTNKVTVISRDNAVDYPLKSKAAVATDIVNHLIATL